MTVYVDSSVLLRVVLRQSGGLAEWKTLQSRVASVLIQVECFRTLDRFRLIDGLDDSAMVRRREVTSTYLSEMQLVGVTGPILIRASEPLPSVLGTLAAVHLATALLWREERGEKLTFATHDARLAAAARAYDFPVIGVR
jgi:predicted nucleic acid-binding protein